MYKALYDFETTDPNVLSFHTNDTFTVVDTSHENYWLVQNINGQLGYVPKNYIGKDESRSFKEVLLSIDRAIASIQKQVASQDGKYTAQQKSNLESLEKHRAKVIKEQQSYPITEDVTAPPIPPREVCPSSQSAVSKTDSNMMNANISQPEQMSLNQSQPMNTTSKKSVAPLPETLYSDLVNCVRNQTNINYQVAQAAVSLVIAELGDKIPSIRQLMVDILSQRANASASDDFELNEDGIKLRQHFKELAACKDDSQQRSWFLHEDESVIKGHLQGLLDILNDANPDICKKVIAEDRYAGVHSLILYYQMEVRIEIRRLLLQVFGALCGLDAKVISEMLNSVLPVELARDMQTGIQDIEKFIYSCLVLTMVFSTAEALPVRHYDHLNEEFLQFLFKLVENPPEDDIEELLPDKVIMVILAFNLHFELPTENAVMKVLAKQVAISTFLEKLILLVNREADPVNILPHESTAPTNSLIKFLSDMYSRPDTANLLYTNDAKVLIDIVLRQIEDRSPGDKLRTKYLSLFHLIVKNSNYTDHCHRQQDFQLIFVRITEEMDSDEYSIRDKMIIKQIWKEFPDLFPQ